MSVDDIKKFYIPSFNIYPIIWPRYLSKNIKLESPSLMKHWQLQKNVERKSAMKQLAEQTDTEKNRLVMYQQQPFDHIKLVKLDIPSDVKFMEDLANYQSMYGIALPAPTLVSPKIREIIISRNYYLEK